jgi:hypothetical protein
MAANNDGHLRFVEQAAADDSAASPKSSVLEKHVGTDIESAYDEEEVIATKESDFKHKQVCAFGDAVTMAKCTCRNSRDGRSCGCPTRRRESSMAILGRHSRN